jgi:hypothetical protein
LVCHFGIDEALGNVSASAKRIYIDSMDKVLGTENRHFQQVAGALARLQQEERSKETFRESAFTMVQLD